MGRELVGDSVMPYVYYVHDHDKHETVYITEELDDARAWIDKHIGLGDYEINKYIDYGVYLFDFAVLS